MLLALYLAVARKQGVPFDQVGGTTQNDVLKEYISRGTHIFPPAPSLRLVADMFAFCSAETPRWNTISISGYHMREAGATAPQELAFTLANGIAYGPGRHRRGPRRRRLRRKALVLLRRAQTTCSKRPPSSAPPDACGPASCATASARRTPDRGCSDSTPRPPASRSRPNSPT